MSVLKKENCKSYATIVLLLLISTWGLIKYRLWNFDDGLIVSRIVRNILEGNGWCYNSDQVLNPSTSALNTILITCFSFIGIWEPDSAAHILGYFSIFICGLLAFKILSKDGERLVSTISASFLVYLLATNSTWGLETNLFFAILLWIIYLQTYNKPAWVLQGFLILTRPDGVLVSLYSLFRFREILKGVLIISLILVPWIFFSLDNFGQIFPSTLSAKIWQGQSGLWGPGHIYLRGLKIHLLEQSWVLKFFFLFSLLGFYRAMKSNSALLVLAVFCAFQQLTYIILNVPNYHWYYLSIDLAAVIFGASAIVWLVSTYLKTEFWHKLQGPAIWIFAAVVALVLAENSSPIADPRDQQYRTAIEALKTLRPSVQYPKATLAAVEVGTIGYADKRKILDLTGLTTLNPEFVSGANTDYFFANPNLPDFLIMHIPFWHFERALTDDVHFELRYQNSELKLLNGVGMQAFELKNVGTPSAEMVTAYVKNKFALAQPVSFKLSSEQQGTECALDHLNGFFIDNSKKYQKIRSSSPLARLRGWSVDKSKSSLDTNVAILLRDRNSSSAWKIPATRVLREDVAAFLKRPEFQMAGFLAEAQAIDIPEGEYEIYVAQGAPEAQTYCDVKQKFVLYRTKSS